MISYGFLFCKLQHSLKVIRLAGVELVRRWFHCPGFVKSNPQVSIINRDL